MSEEITENLQPIMRGKSNPGESLLIIYLKMISWEEK